MASLLLWLFSQVLLVSIWILLEEHSLTAKSLPSSGGNLSWRTVLILGLSSMAANSISLGISEFLSSKAHREFLKAEKRRELWEFKNYREVEILEMINRFEARGMERKDAELVVSKMAQYENFFVGLMVAEELGLQLPDDDDAMLLTDAFIMCVSFGLFGCIPIAVFCLGIWGITSQHHLYIISLSISLLLLAILAIIKSTFSSATALHSVVEAICLGVVCSALSYAVGAGVMNLIST